MNASPFQGKIHLINIAIDDIAYSYWIFGYDFRNI
jgi:hypothetical protein